MTDWSDSLVLPLRDSEWLIASVADVTGADPAVVRARLRKEHLWNPCAVPEAFFAKNLTPYVYNQEMIRFYEETDSFIYGIIAWNRTSTKCRMREWILDCLHRNGLKSGKILLCGDGIGVDSFFFAKNGFQVTSFEVSRLGVDFAEKMFTKFGVDVTISGSLEALEEGTFDAILCLDVLEHLPDPVASVAQSSKLLRPGGFFISSSPFFLVGKQWPTHLNSNRKFSGRVRIFEQAGEMRQVDGRFFQNPIVFQRNGGTEAPKMSLGKRFLLWYGSCWLAIFGTFPQIMPFLIQKIFRSDPQLLKLIPDEKRTDSV